MDLLQENKLNLIIRMEIIMFIIFSLLSIIFYQYNPAHSYYHQGVFFKNIDSIIGLFGFIIKVLFFWIILLFPILWILQLVLLFRHRIIKKYLTKTLILTFVYLISILSLFSLFSIDNKQILQQKKYHNIGETNK